MQTKSAQSTHDELERILRDLKILQDNSSRYAEETQVNVELRERWKALNEILRSKAPQADELAKLRADVDNQISDARIDKESVLHLNLLNLHPTCTLNLHRHRHPKLWQYYDQTVMYGTIHSSKKLSKNGNEGRNKSACENDAIKTRGVEGWWYNTKMGTTRYVHCSQV
jgi:hypothetical protein